VSYLACARRLLAAPDAVFPQFATHNAHTLAAIHEMADPSTWHPQQYEFQCLHGMGEPLYEQVVAPPSAGGLGRPCRIYAPVGTHETLLAYLVRRLLENGANTSFVHRVADPTIPLEALTEDPVATVQAWAAAEGQVGRPHPHIPAPVALYGGARANSAGLDLADEAALAMLQQALTDSRRAPLQVQALLADGAAPCGPARTVRNPAYHADVVGVVHEASADDARTALHAAARAAATWAHTPPAQRAAVLRAAADRLQADLPGCVALLMREAGKTAANAVAEVREAIDFLRYYAAQIADAHWPADAPALGPVVCISPWNFPLAIFTGQIAAALAAGNPVVAKPAEQTPLIAARMTAWLHDAGVPRDVLQLLPGAGETVGAALVADPATAGVLFTGSTEVARLLQRSLAQRVARDPNGRVRPVPLVAETGGQNAMVVDTSALPEQVVQDVLTSAFDSAGQRCSALRVLCVQEEAADRILTMLRGAMAELRVDDPGRLATDVGRGHRRGSARRHPAPYRGDARARLPGVASPAATAGRGRDLRAAHRDRAAWTRVTHARGLRPRAARGALAARATGRARRGHPRHRLRTDVWRAQPHRRDHRAPDPHRARGAITTSTATWWAPWWACNRSAARGCRAPDRRRAAPCICIGCWHAPPRMP
jgi:RHH-type proline utilization regulon transcriptional repressor/proline dehydrogenase/delta 1-pyrroline-5-carboxylate dehydrogenase